MENKVLLVNQSTGYLMTDIVNAYVKSGKYDRVELFAGEINIRPSVPDESVKIIKTIKYNKTNTAFRLVTWFAAFVHLLFVIWLKSDKYKLVLVSNPPLTIFVPLFTKKRFDYIVYDLYPDSLFSQGFIKKDSIIGKWWINKNIRVLHKADHVFTLSRDMKKAVSQYVCDEKITVVENWAHNEHIKPVPKEENVFLQGFSLTGKFIVLYSGNMGMTHDIDVIVDVADILKECENIHFVFIGEGAKKQLINDKIRGYGLNNCSLLPFQPLEMLPFSMGAADIAVVTTDNRQSGLSVPSKTYTYLAAGAALLCLADANTELGRITNELNVGKCFTKDQTEGIANFILSLSQDSAIVNKYKSNARKASMMFSPDNADKYVY